MKIFDELNNISVVKLLNAGKPLKLDSSDYATLKDFVKGDGTLPILTKAQMLKAFE